MISRVTPSFWRALRAMSPVDQQAARRAYRQFLVDPSHNSLRFKKLHREGDTIGWVWIGSHGEFDRRFG